MFSGIIEETGGILRRTSRRDVSELSVAAALVSRDMRKGDSIAVNGVCLTVEQVNPGRDFCVCLSRQTRDETNLGTIIAGQRVNLERALVLGQRIGGHFLTGHVDCRIPLLGMERTGESAVLRVRIPPRYVRYVVERGSIGIDGVSLTVGRLERDIASVWLIPYTLATTALSERVAGSMVNVEFDLFAKYVARCVGHAGPARKTGAEEQVP